MSVIPLDPKKKREPDGEGKEWVETRDEVSAVLAFLRDVYYWHGDGTAFEGTNHNFGIWSCPHQTGHPG